MSDRDPKGRVPELLLERLAAGELDDAAARAVRARLEAEEGGLARLDAIRRSDEEVLAAYPPARMAKDIEDRLRVEQAAERERRRGAGVWIGLPAAAAVAALLLVVVVPRDVATGSDGDVETILTKGAEPRLRVFVRTPDGARALDEGAVARRGDVLQLAYVAAGQAYGVIASVDGGGGVTLHLPHRGGPAVALERGGLVRLDSAFELDDAPGYERFFFVTSAEPFSSALVEEAARALIASGDAERGALKLPEGMAQVASVVRKDGVPEGR